MAEHCFANISTAYHAILCHPMAKHFIALAFSPNHAILWQSILWQISAQHLMPSYVILGHPMAIPAHHIMPERLGDISPAYHIILWHTPRKYTTLMLAF